jgi:hypothetical protein
LPAGRWVATSRSCGLTLLFHVVGPMREPWRDQWWAGLMAASGVSGRSAGWEQVAGFNLEHKLGFYELADGFHE